MTGRLIKMPEASERLRAPINTLRDWRRRGIGPKSFRVGRSVVYSEDELEAWLAQQEATGARGDGAA